MDDHAQGPLDHPYNGTYFPLDNHVAAAWADRGPNRALTLWATCRAVNDRPEVFLWRAFWVTSNLSAAVVRATFLLNFSLLERPEPYGDRRRLAAALQSGHSVRVSPNARDACPELHQLLGAYLHQDADLNFDSAEEALAAGLAEAATERLMAAAGELRSKRPPAEDEGGTRRFVNELCDYHPPGDDLTYVAWLDRVQEALDRAQQP